MVFDISKPDGIINIHIIHIWYNKYVSVDVYLGCWWLYSYKYKQILLFSLFISREIGSSKYGHGHGLVKLIWSA